MVEVIAVEMVTSVPSARIWRKRALMRWLVC